MRNSGVAIMGTATAIGDDRAIRAADEALNSPLLEESNIIGAKQILVNISSGTKEVTMDEVFHITQFIQEEAGDANLIFGTCYDEKLGDALSVTVIATGFETNITGAKQSKPAGNTANGPDRVWLDGENAGHSISAVTGATKRPLYDNDRSEIANSVTFDLSTSSNNYEKYRQNQYSTQEPFIKNASESAVQTEDRRRFMLRDAARREQQRPAVKMNVPQNLADVENVPAYMRRNIRLDDVPHSSEPIISRWTISEDDDEIRSNNSFLHDNVD
jgi:cell division protein FtsZ